MPGETNLHSTMIMTSSSVAYLFFRLAKGRNVLTQINAHSALIVAETFKLLLHRAHLLSELLIASAHGGLVVLLHCSLAT